MIKLLSPTGRLSQMPAPLWYVSPAQDLPSTAGANGQDGQPQSFWKSMLAADPVTQKQKDMKARLDLLWYHYLRAFLAGGMHSASPIRHPVNFLAQRSSPA